MGACSAAQAGGKSRRSAVDRLAAAFEAASTGAIVATAVAAWTS
jgi:hypothetical protein